MKLKYWLLVSQIRRTLCLSFSVRCKGIRSLSVAAPGFRMTPGLEERRIAAVVGALVADAAGMYQMHFHTYICTIILSWSCPSEESLGPKIPTKSSDAQAELSLHCGHVILLVLSCTGSVKLEISSVHVMHTMKLRFHEQTDIRYNSVLHGNRANSKPFQRDLARTARIHIYKWMRAKRK